MQCDVCGKNPATVHLTEIIDEQMTELHLCEPCAKSKSLEMEQQFGLGDLLAGLSDLGKNVLEEKEAGKLKCSACGFTYNDFRKIGRFGCGGCYVSFKKYLVPLLRRIHGSSKHLGKMPISGMQPQKAASAPSVSSALPVIQATVQTPGLEDLKERLKLAVVREEFEEAARLRDLIKELENK